MGDMRSSDYVEFHTSTTPTRRYRHRQKKNLYGKSLQSPLLKLLCAMKVTIKEWNAVATWRWDMPDDDVCGICRVQFDGTCPTCKFPGDDCSLRMSQHITWSSRIETDMDSVQCSESVAIPFTWWVEDNRHRGIDHLQQTDGVI